MFATVRSISRIPSITSVAPVLLAAGMLTIAGGDASHAADGEPAATGKTAVAASGNWTVLITPATSSPSSRTDDTAPTDGPVIQPAQLAAPSPPPLPRPAERSRAVARGDAGIGESIATTSVVEDAVEETDEVLVLPVRYRTYREAYRAVPFRRSEYLANPSYRHDAAMELLFGKMRPTVIHRHVVQPRPVRTVAVFSPYSVRSPWLDYSRGPYSRYAGLFGYRGGYRPQYYIGGSYGW